ARLAVSARVGRSMRAENAGVRAGELAARLKPLLSVPVHDRSVKNETVPSKSDSPLFVTRASTLPVPTKVRSRKGESVPKVALTNSVAFCALPRLIVTAK